MRSVSAAFTDAIAENHEVVAKAEVLRDGVVEATLPVTAGEVTVDVDNAIRRRCRGTLTDPEGTLTPADADDLLAPFGTEVRLWRGIRFADGSEELLPLGVFGLAQSDVQDTAEGLTIAIDGFDRARRVQRARFTDVYTIASGTNYATAIKDLIQNRVPAFTDKDFSFTTTTRTTPTLTFDVGDDPWERAQDMAQSMGAELFFDADGVCTLRLSTSADQVPVAARFVEGENATILSVGKKMTDQYTYNYVVVVGEPMEGAPVRAVAQDTDPDSPTNVNGDYGVVVRFLRSPYIATQAQAQDAADSLLLRYKGATELVTFSAIPNPAHEAGDLVEIVRGRSKVDAEYVMDALTLPLEHSSPMTVTCKRRRV